MPKLVWEVPDTIESVVRPVIWEITKDLCRRVGISEQIRMLYPGESEYVLQQGSAIDDSETKPHTVGDGRLTIRVDEEFDQQQALAQAVEQPEHLPVWKDDALNIYLKPSYAHTNFTINFEFRAKDKTLAMRWRDEMKSRVAMLRDLFLHDVKYHYGIPEVFIPVLQELYRMREAVAPYGEDWLTYFTNHASTRVGQIASLSGNKTLWVVSETQTRVQGRFTFEDAPERGEKNAEGETWNISFSYKFELEKPIACALEYPLVVHNQVVAANFRPTKSDLPQRPEDVAKSRPLSLLGFAAFETGRWTSDRRTPTTPGLAIPDYDEFLPRGIPSRSMRLFTALTTIDTAPAGDPKLLMDLTVLSKNYKLDAGLLAYMQQISPWLNVPGRTPLLVSVYQNENLLSGYHVSVAPDLKVYLVDTPDLRQTYHVRLSLMTSWSGIPWEALAPLQSDATTLLKLLTAIDCRATLSKVLSTGWVPRQAFQEAIDFLDSADRAKGNGQKYTYSTVATLFVNAARKES